MQEQFHLKNGQLQRTLTTDNFSHPVTPGIICKVLDLGCYVIYLNTDRNRTWLGLVFFLKKKKGLDTSFEVRPVFVPCLPLGKGQNSCHWFTIPHIQVEPLGRVGTFCEH